jgi:hypothetical protein
MLIRRYLTESHILIFNDREEEKVTCAMRTDLHPG